MLKVFVCIRSKQNSWEGALIIVAESIERAKQIFANHYDNTFRDEPEEIKELDVSNEGIIYNDEAR